jgi:hypothetical protein
MNNDYLIILGIIDNIHDFFELESNNKSNKIFNNYIKFYIQELKNINKNINILPYTNPLYINLFNNSFLINNVNDENYRKNVKMDILDSIKQKYIEIDKINNRIIENFNHIFNIDKINFNNNFITNKKLNLILNDRQKILLRHPLYYLIKESDDNIINFFIEYMSIDILPPNILNIIKSRIKCNIKSFDKTKNITYPITFFDDMATGLNKSFYKFKILNRDKKLIDQASVEETTSYFDNYEEGIHYRQFFINNLDNSINFGLDTINDKLIYLNSSYYLKDNLIFCEQKIDNANNIILKIKNNSVGRSATTNTNFGIYDTIIVLHDILLDYHVIKSSIENNNKTKSIRVKLYKDKIEKFINHYHTLIKKSIDEIYKIKILVDKIKNFKYKTNEELLNLYFIKKIYKKNGDSTERVLKFDDFQNKLNNIYIYPDNYISYLNLINTHNYNCNILLKETINESLFINLFDIEPSIISYIIPVSKEIYEIQNKYKTDFIYFDGNKITDICSEFIIDNELISKMKLIDNIILLNDISSNLIKIYKKYYNQSTGSLDYCYGCITYLLFGAKRFGDWIQADLSKKMYFMLQTTDLYCQLYSYIIGAPIIFNKSNIIYNYEVPDNLEKLDYNNLLEKFNKENQKEKVNIDTDQIIYEGLNYIKTNNLSRHYYEKYIKYKNKYLELKDKLL